jgi:hypothetical protein
MIPPHAARCKLGAEEEAVLFARCTQVTPVAQVQRVWQVQVPRMRQGRLARAETGAATAGAVNPLMRWGLAGLVLVTFVTGDSMSALTSVVSVEGGQIAGVLDRGVRVFKGIPYAAAPVGALRWKPPHSIRSWSGIRDASQFGAECPQTDYPSGSIYIRPRQPQSEDCLFLNVWTTADAGDQRPVFVWIHGGALTKGSGISDTRDGVPLARKGIVLVSINYRLGPLGYLAHPELSAESPQQSSGNYGVLDQIAALYWVQKNIAAFGGDPARVTIGGESAGSWSVNTLVASPLAKGLFIRAIGQSAAVASAAPRICEKIAGLSSRQKELASHSVRHSAPSPWPHSVRCPRTRSSVKPSAPRRTLTAGCYPMKSARSSFRSDTTTCW